MTNSDSNVVRIGYYYETASDHYVKECKDELNGALKQRSNLDIIDKWNIREHGPLPTIEVYSEDFQEFDSLTGERLEEVMSFIWDELGMLVEDGFVYAFDRLYDNPDIVIPDQPIIQTLADAIKEHGLDYELEFLAYNNEYGPAFTKHPIM